MYEDMLKSLVEKGLSTYKIADELKISQTQVRVLLKKYNLKTQKASKESNCIVCDKPSKRK